MFLLSIILPKKEYVNATNGMEANFIKRGGGLNFFEKPLDMGIYLWHYGYVPKRKEGSKMGQTDKQFGGFLRMLISRMKKAIDEKDSEKAKELMKEILDDLQATLED